MLALKFLVRNPALSAEPKGNQLPPWWIRGILILTCIGVNFAHGSNDGQMGIGLIMLILIGTLPTAYALNHKPAPNHVDRSRQHLPQQQPSSKTKPLCTACLCDPRPAVTAFV